MNNKLKIVGLRAGLALLAATAFLGAGTVVMAQDKSAPAPAAAASTAPAKEIKDERALKLLRGMSDKLAGAKSLSFQFRGLVPSSGPTGQFINLLASSRVVMQRPDKLFVSARGDLFPSDLYYNGKTVTAVGVAQKFYAQREAAGGAIETVMQGGQPGGDGVAPFLDLLVADPYAVLTRDLSSALWVGQSTVGGVKTDHLAFTAKDVDWEIWIGAHDKLPRLMVVSYRTGERQPTFTVELSDWKVNASVPASTFNAVIPKGAVKIEFKPHGPAPTK
jgi:hypothetical protein